MPIVLWLAVAIVLFDVLYAGGRWLMDRPYEVRRSLLEGLVPPGANWQVTPSHVGRGAEMLEAARGHGLEGIVAKRLDSVYVPGSTSRSARTASFG